jgi:hypothetical protein
MFPTSGSTGLISGRFKVVTKTPSVMQLHAKVKPSDCTSGTLRVAGTVPVIEARLGHGRRGWEVGTSTGTIGGGTIQPTDVSLTVRGIRQVNGTASIAFPANGHKGTGSIGWGDDGSGFQTCLVSFGIKHG